MSEVISGKANARTAVTCVGKCIYIASASPGIPGEPAARRNRIFRRHPKIATKKRIYVKNFWFHDLRHTVVSWYMMNDGDLYELAKILGHSNIKMFERHAKLGHEHITRTSSTAKVILNMDEEEAGEVQEEDVQRHLA